MAVHSISVLEMSCSGQYSRWGTLLPVSHSHPVPAGAVGGGSGIRRLQGRAVHLRAAKNPGVEETIDPNLCINRRMALRRMKSSS